MATYQELFDRYNSDALYNRMVIGIAVVADVIRLEPPATQNHAARVLWAKTAMANPRDEARRLALAVLAQNRSATVSQIDLATDATLQASINSAVDLLTG